MSIVRAAQLDLTEADLRAVAECFDLDRLVAHGGYENALFRSEPGGSVVRLTHSSRRSVALIEGELGFMEYLARQGVSVVAPVRSQRGSLAEEIVLAAGDSVIAVCMTEAPGARRVPEEWSLNEISSYGSLLGALHVASRSFEPATDRRRPAWTDPVLDAGLGAPGASPELSRRHREIVETALAHPAGGAELLIHQDAHYSNLFLTDDGRITLFDFDDCAYGTETHDVAIVLFYWVFGRPVDPAAEAHRFLAPFLAGYQRHARLPDGWQDGADVFLSYRELDLFWLLGMEPEIASSPEMARFMDGRRERVLAGVPYLGVPLASIDLSAP